MLLPERENRGKAPARSTSELLEVDVSRALESPPPEQSKCSYRCCAYLLVVNEHADEAPAAAEPALEKDDEAEITQITVALSSWKWKNMKKLVGKHHF